MNIDDLNEPAFPIAGALAGYQFSGMSLRDHFAGQALPGILAQTDWTHHLSTTQTIAGDAYAIADAMLVERAK